MRFAGGHALPFFRYPYIISCENKEGENDMKLLMILLAVGALLTGCTSFRQVADGDGMVNSYVQISQDEAKRMKIEHPERTTQDISQRCGFSSPRAFYRTFSRETGMTPKDWWINQRDNS